MLLLVSNWAGGQESYLAGRACMYQGFYDSARYHLELALEEEPGNAEIFFHLGQVLLELKQFPDARNAFYEAERRRKGSAAFYLAKCEVRLHHPEQALKFLRSHLESRFKKPESEILLDEDLRQLENTEGWKKLWNEKNWYRQNDQTYMEAMFLTKNGDHLEAINLLNQLEKKAYKRSQVQLEKARIYQLLNNPKAERSELRSAVKSDVRNLDAFKRLAEIQLEEGDVEEALRGLDKVLRSDPAQFDSYLLRARAKSRSGDLRGAISDMDTYLLYFPKSDTAYFLKGQIQFENERYLDALQSFNRCLSMNQGSAAYFYARGMTYAATRTLRYAEKDLSMALDLDPLNGKIWFEKGKLADQLGRADDACHCYQKASQYGVREAHERYYERCQ